jgi:beta-glucuronidase
MQLDGVWLFRFDRGKGLRDHFQSSFTTKGWSQVTVPDAWNATNQSRASMRGTVAWYRKDFRIPSLRPGTSWIVRFESVNNRLRAWLNGKPIGSHAGPFLPFELVLPPDLLVRGINHLVVRIDSHRRSTDFPGAGIFWNYGGILREVYLQRVDKLGFGAVQVLPRLPCPTCEATIDFHVAVRNYSSATEQARLTGTYGTIAADLGEASIPAGASVTLSQQVTVPHPELWWPSDPHLYDVQLALAAKHPGSSSWADVGRYFLRSGVRSITVSPEGALLLNGQALNFRGVGLIEDSKQFGGALDASIDRRIITEVKELGATEIRSQYPLDEYLEELADENGILLWSEIPVDELPSSALAKASLRERAVQELEQNILTNSSHPSIVIWSIANELDPKPNAVEGAYIAKAVSAAHALDPTRPVGLAVAAYPSSGCQARYYAPLEVIGLNDYFGWYPGPNGQLKNPEALSPYLDEAHSCYPNKALIVTEFGAEANRAGPVAERGTYAFQREFVKYHLGVFAQKPWLAGASYWALEEFRVEPGWSGGNPKPSPPIHTKGLISFTGVRKPAFYEVQQIYHSTEQLRPPP